MSASPAVVNHYDDHGHTPLAPFQQDAGRRVPLTSLSALTRTVAIIKTHALEQRLEIEPRIIEANFEVSVLFRGCTPFLRVYPPLADPPR